MLFYLWKYLVECYLDAFCLCFKCLEFSSWKNKETVLIASKSILLGGRLEKCSQGVKWKALNK